MMSITDGGNDPPQRRSANSPTRPRRRLAVGCRAQAAHRPDGQGDRHVRQRRRQVDGDASNPQQPLPGSLDMARVGYQVISDVAALAIMPDDSPTSLKGKPIGRKVVAWSEPMPLDKVKADRQGARLLDQRRAARLRGRRDRHLPARPGRGHHRQADPRDGAGQPAAAVRGLEARQTASGSRRSCCRSRRQPGRARLRGAPPHERTEGELPAADAFAVLAIAAC